MIHNETAGPAQGRTRLFGSPRAVTAALTVPILAICLSACGSSSPSSGQKPSSTKSTAAKSSSGSTGSSSGVSIGSFESKLLSGEHSTYLAKYRLNGQAGGTSTVGTMTVAHQNANTLIAAATARGSFEEIIAAGKVTICANEAGAWHCFNGSILGQFERLLKPLLRLYSVKGQLAALKDEQRTAYDVTSSTRSVGGQTVNCITYHSHVDAGVYTVCANAQGVMAEAIGQNTSGHWTLTLTSLTSSVPGSEFTPPAAPTSL